jgi:hypothetical protein
VNYTRTSALTGNPPKAGRVKVLRIEDEIRIVQQVNERRF